MHRLFWQLIRAVSAPHRRHHLRQRRTARYLSRRPDRHRTHRRLPPRLHVIVARHHAPAPPAPAPRLAARLPPQHPRRAALLLPLRHASPHAHHAHELALDDAADTFNLMALVARAEEERGRGALVDAGGFLDVVFDGVGVVREGGRGR